MDLRRVSHATVKADENATGVTVALESIAIASSARATSAACTDAISVSKPITNNSVWSRRRNARPSRNAFSSRHGKETLRVRAKTTSNLKCERRLPVLWMRYSNEVALIFVDKGSGGRNP